MSLRERVTDTEAMIQRLENEAESFGGTLNYEMLMLRVRLRHLWLTILAEIFERNPRRR